VRGVILGAVVGAIIGLVQIGFAGPWLGIGDDTGLAVLLYPFVIVASAAYGVWLLWPREQSLRERWRDTFSKD
jgi:hypothetical protein